MDSIEKSYWERPKNPLAARHFIVSLMDNGRFIEASYYCNKLLAENPTDLNANRLGFLLAIQRMEPNVSIFDSNLIKANMKNQERFVLHCRYYFAFHDRIHLRNSLSAVIDEGTLNEDSLQVVIESLLWLKDFPLTTKFISLHVGSRIRFTPQAEKELRAILLTRLVEIFSLSRRIL
jgi:hypothetical protein